MGSNFKPYAQASGGHVVVDVEPDVVDGPVYGVVDAVVVEGPVVVVEVVVVVVLD